MRGKLQASEATEVSEPQRASRSEVVVRMQEQRCSGHRRAQRAQQVTGERSELPGEAVSGASSADEASEASQAGEATSPTCEADIAGERSEQRVRRAK